MKIILATAVLALLCACSGKPSEGQIREQLKAYLAEDGADELFDVGRFEQLNGIEHDERNYTAQVQYELVFKQSAEALAKESKARNRGNLAGGLTDGLAIMALTAQFGNFQEGDAHAQKADVKMIKTDKGWRLDSLETE